MWRHSIFINLRFYHIWIRWISFDVLVLTLQRLTGFPVVRENLEKAVLRKSQEKPGKAVNICKISQKS